MTIEYQLNKTISVAEFKGLLIDSTLGARRPIDNEETLASMLAYGNLLITAWHGEKLVGVSRSVTDFAYCCYLSDLAVHQDYQHQGIGKALIQKTQDALQESCSLILLSAPAAVNYYPHIGMSHHPQAWMLRPGQKLTEEKS